MMLQSMALLAHAIRLGREGVDTYHWMVFNNLLSQAMLLCIVLASALSWRGRSRKKASSFHFVADPAA